MKSIRDYINLVEGGQLDEAGPYTAGQPAPAAAPTGNSFDAKLAQAQAAQQAKGGRTGPAPVAKVVPDPKGPGPRPTGWFGNNTINGDSARWDAQYAAKYNPDGTAKQAAPTVAKPDPAVLKIQQDLIAKGATNPDGTPLKADGIMGANTKAAQAKLAASPVTPEKPSGAAMPAQPAEPTPAAPTGPWPAGSPQDAAWQKLSPEVQKKIGQADPTDPIIVNRMANGEFGGIFGGAAANTNPDGTPKVNQAAKPAPLTPQNDPAMKDFMGEGSFQNDELTRIISIVQHR